MSLNKRYNVVQLSNYDQFINISKTKKFSRIVIDTSAFTKDETNILIENKLNNLVIIFEEEINQHLEKSSILNIVKNELLNNINKI